MHLNTCKFEQICSTQANKAFRGQNWNYTATSSNLIKIIIIKDDQEWTPT